jgi:DDE superfamily endonuclease
VNCQAIADAHDKCIHLSISTSGSTHDNTAWTISPLSQEWAENTTTDPRTGRQFWLSLDNAYQATANQLPPWPGTGLISRAPFKDAFNYFFSAGCRNGIERLFAQVYQRWGILWRPIRFSIEHTGMIVMALFQLHNFLKGQGEADLPDLGSGLGARWEGELVRAVDETEGYDDTYHPSDTCHIEHVNLRHP